MLVSEGLLGPSVLVHDLGFLLRSEVVLDVEVIADLRNGHALDDTGDLGASKLEERLDVEEVGSEDQLEQEFLLDIDVVGVPLVDDIGELVGAKRLVDFRRGVLGDVLAVDNDLLKNCLLDLREGNVLLGTGFFNDTADQHRVLGDVLLNLDDLAVGGQ